MKGDFTRITFKKEKHYSSIRRQQGRVDLDADSNEQADITSYRVETETRDVIGSCGFPQADPGYSVVDWTALSAAEKSALTNEGLLPLQSGDFLIGAGRAYVNGILCENEDIVSFTKQPDLQPDALQKSTSYCVYLDVWQRHLTALDDPEIREVALGGPDTATRTKTVWQVRALDVGNAGSSITCATVPGWDDATAASTMKLSARASQEQPSDKPCILPPGAGYRRLENQLYRVEIHDPGVVGGGGATPTFKWSRDNGSVVAAINATSATTVTLNAPGKDHALGFAEGQWIELLDDRHDWESQPGVPVPITSVNDLELTVDAGQAILPGGTAPNLLTSLDPQYHPKARRWDSIGTTPATIPGTNDGFLPLEDGVEIKFEPGTCKTGDYWVIPARTDKGDVEWPLDNGTPPKPIPQLPGGITHSFCRLAIVDVDGSGNATVIEDCRQVFPPLTGIEDCCGCCTKTVGQTTAADFSSIQAAINSLPADGGQICVLEGTFAECVVIDSKQNITIIGCGERSRLTLPAGSDPNAPIIEITKSANIRIEALAFNCTTSSAVAAIDSRDVTVCECEIRMSEPKGVQPAIFYQVFEGLIERNVIFGGRPLREGEPLPLIDSMAPFSTNFCASGIQLAGGTQHVRVINNIIAAVTGQGITLGSFQSKGGNGEPPTIGNPVDPENPCAGCDPPSAELPPGRDPTGGGISLSSLLDIHIKCNRILHAGLDGIGVIKFDPSGKTLVAVAGLTIVGNEILGCLQLKHATVINPNGAGYGGIALAFVSDLIIRDNVIEDNGTQYPQAACGIFVLFGEGIEISRNRIINNGGPFDPKDPGRRGGIQIVWAVATLQSAGSTDQWKRQVSLIVNPALIVHNNVVSAQLGQALSAGALGSVSVIGNELSTYGVLPNESDFIFLNAATVLILNLGTTPDAGAIPRGAGVLRGLTPNWFFDGDVLVASNQCYLKSIQQSTKGSGFFSVSILSEGDVSFENNQSSCFLPVEPRALLVDTLAASSTSLRVIGNRFEETPRSVLLSAITSAPVNTTALNQATHRIEVLPLQPPKTVDQFNTVIV